jgi:uncharacterized protein YdbL (DUF1318 family)
MSWFSKASRCGLAGPFAPVAIGALVLLGSAVLPAFAQNAETLRREAKACEQPDGFMRAITPDARAAVETINNQRRTVYTQRAQQERVEMAAVAVVYAQEITKQPDYRACPN